MTLARWTCALALTQICWKQYPELIAGVSRRTSNSAQLLGLCLRRTVHQARKWVKHAGSRIPVNRAERSSAATQV